MCQSPHYKKGFPPFIVRGVGLTLVSCEEAGISKKVLFEAHDVKDQE